MRARIAAGVRHRIGFRGALLLVLGFFDLWYAATKMIWPDPVAANSQQNQLLAQVFPLDNMRTSMIAWGYLWVLAGLVLIVNAFRRDDRWGYATAIGIKLSWVGGNIYAWVHGLVGGGSTVGLWCVITGMIVIESLRPEPSPEVEAFLRDMRRAGNAEPGQDTGGEA